MSVSAHFSVTTAGALVVAGVAACALTLVIALKSSEREQRGQPANGAAPPSASAQMKAMPSAAPGQEGEYLLDVSDPAAFPRAP